MKRFVGLLVVLLLVGCSGTPPATPSRTLSPGEAWVPIAHMPEVCAGVGLDGPRIHGSPDDPRLVWMGSPKGERTELAWPLGHAARFDPELVMLDGRGNQIAIEGQTVTGRCGTLEPGIFSVDLGARDRPPDPSARVGP